MKSNKKCRKSLMNLHKYLVTKIACRSVFYSYDKGYIYATGFTEKIDHNSVLFAKNSCYDLAFLWTVFVLY